MWKTDTPHIMREAELKPYVFKLSLSNLHSHDESSSYSVKHFDDKASDQNERKLSFPGSVFKLLS